MDMEKIAAFKKMIDESEKIVFFGGAGISTESGIPDFRSQDGLYNQKYSLPPEEILSYTYYRNHPEEFFKFYKDKMIYEDAKPNKAHYAVAELERRGKLLCCITQNIDGLHTEAGCKTVYELHGSVHRNYCTRCNKFYDLDFVKNSEGIPRCTECGHIVKPDVVLYEESLRADLLSLSRMALGHADLLIIGGTSLTVYPAAGLIRYFKGKNIVVINKTATSADETASLVFRDNAGDVLSLAVGV